MTHALIFGLLAAGLWGTTDFVIRIASRRMGVFRAMLYAQATSAVVVCLWVALDPTIREGLLGASARGWWAAFIAAGAGLTATAALYHALHRGRVSVVAPVAAGYGAVTSLLSWLTGEQLGAVSLLGLGALLAGVVLVSIPSTAPLRTISEARLMPHTSGLGWALVSCCGYGVEFWVQGRFANPLLGPVPPVAVYYLLSTTVLVMVGRIRGFPFSLSQDNAALACATGIAAIAGFISLSVGFGTGHVAVVTAVGSVQSAITVALACIFIADRLAPHHWLGLVAVVGGLSLIRLG